MFMRGGCEYRPESALRLPRVRYCNYPVAPALAQHVSQFFSVECVAPETRAVRTYADGCIDLICDVTRAELQVSGASRRGATYTVRGPHHLVGARFWPGGAHSLLGVPAAELENGWTPLAALLPALAAEWGERIALASSATQRFSLLEELLLRRLIDMHVDARIQRATHLLVGTCGAIAMPMLARESGASERNLSRLFHQWVGVRPKELARIIRFQAVLRRARDSGRPDWGALAAGAGYADQAHLVREFAVFSGEPPDTHVAALAEIFNTAPRNRSTLCADEA
jgi:AraC-like DNA-binding protein